MVFYLQVRTFFANKLLCQPMHHLSCCLRYNALCDDLLNLSCCTVWAQTGYLKVALLADATFSVGATYTFLDGSTVKTQKTKQTLKIPLRMKSFLIRIFWLFYLCMYVFISRQLLHLIFYGKRCTCEQNWSGKETRLCLLLFCITFSLHITLYKLTMK